MEIRDYVSQMGWRLWGLALLPLVAGGVVFALLADTPRQYLATSVLTVPSSVAGGSSSGSVAQYMANFEQTIVSDRVIEAVAERVRVGGSDVREGLQTTQLGASNLVRVSFQGPESADAARIVDLATRRAFKLVAEIQLPFGESLDTLEARLQSSSVALEGAERRLEEFLLNNGLVLPREQYLMAAGEVSRLESEIVRAEAEGISTVALEAALAESRQELADLGSVIPEYERLQAAVDRAEADVDQDQDELRLAQSQKALSEPRMTDVSVEPKSTIQTVGRAVGIAAAVGFMFAVGLLVLFPSWRVEQKPGERQEPSTSTVGDART